MNEKGCNMSNTHGISDQSHRFAAFEWENDKSAVEDDASYDYEYEYDEEEGADCGSEDGDVLPTDIESTKRALRRLSIQMHAAIDGSLLVNSEANRRNTWTDNDDMPSKESVSWKTAKSASAHGLHEVHVVAEEAKGVPASCDASLDDGEYIEEVIDDDEYEEEVIEEEILTDDEDFFDTAVEKHQSQNEVVGEFNGTTIYSEVTQPSLAARRQTKVAEMDTLDERSVETDADLRYQLDHWRDQSYRSIATTGRPVSDQVERTGDDVVGNDNEADGEKEVEDSQDEDRHASDDADDGGEEEDVTPEDVKEAIIYILKQEKPIDKGYLTSEQATRMMALPFADQKEILKHFELCDNAGDPICWDLLVAMSNQEDEHADESDDGESAGCCSCGHNSNDNNSVCLSVNRDNGDDPVLQAKESDCSSPRSEAEQDAGEEQDNGHNEESEEEIVLEDGEELDPDDDHVEEESMDEEVVDQTEQDEDEVVEEVDETELDPSASSVHDDNNDDSSGSGSGPLLSSDDEHEAREIESLGSGQYSLRADSTHCASSVTYNENTEVGSDEENSESEEAQNVHLQAMRRDRKLRQQSKSS